MPPASQINDPPQVRFEPDRGWICSCTGVWVERVDFDLDCHHWPLCEHIVAAAKQAAVLKRASVGDD